MNLCMPSSLAVKTYAESFVQFLNKCVTPFHAVQTCESILESAGFTELFEKENFTVQPGGKYYIKKNDSTIFALAVGGKYTAGNGFSIVVAHTDSPCLRVKPVSKRTTENFLQVGISTYGGGLWRTWFDRDLSVAGQVYYLREGLIYHKLVDIKRPILYIPNLAIHLDTERQKFEFNVETNLLPLLATTTTTDLKASTNSTTDDVKTKLNCSIANEHHEDFLKLIANEAKCNVEELLNLDLYLYDTQPGAIGGLREEFISGARLDNLVGTYTAITGLIESLSGNDFLEDPNIRLVACYDHEEVGSVSAQGAKSAFSEWLLRRLASPPNVIDVTSFERAIAKSYLISADQAHCLHPNYSEKHENKHRPEFHGGVVVKINVNQSYATSALTHAILKVIADKANVPLQNFVVRNNSLCGSTVGPILSTILGLQSIDVGCPQLAMHSIREFTDTTSILQARILYSSFFKHLPDVLQSVQKLPS